MNHSNYTARINVCEKYKIPKELQIFKRRIPFWQTKNLTVFILCFFGLLGIKGGGTDLAPSLFSYSNNCAIVIKPGRNTLKHKKFKQLKLFNTLTANYENSRSNMDNFQLPVQM